MQLLLLTPRILLVEPIETPRSLSPVETTVG